MYLLSPTFHCCSNTPDLHRIHFQDHPLRTAAAHSALQEKVQHLAVRDPAQGAGRAGGQQGGAAQQAPQKDAGAHPGLWQLHEPRPAR